MMITRTNPFEHESYEQLIKNNLKGVINFMLLLKGTTPASEDMISLIKKMLIADPKQRPSASQLLATFMIDIGMD